jgi:hypothetical protein
MEAQTIIGMAKLDLEGGGNYGRLRSDPPHGSIITTNGSLAIHLQPHRMPPR